MIPQEALDAASRAVLGLGVKVLQGVRFADTDEAHVDFLRRFMHPKPDTLWADIGCGFGEVARLMKDKRPDLDFVLINSNGFQLSLAPEGFRRLQADMHTIPLDDASVDGCMFLYSLCHADPIEAALAEAARITKPCGELFVFDYFRAHGDNRLMRQRLHAAAYSVQEMRAFAAVAGWQMTKKIAPTPDDTLFRGLYGNDEEYDRIFRDLFPVLWKAVRL